MKHGSNIFVQPHLLINVVLFSLLSNISFNFLCFAVRMSIEKQALESSCTDITVTYSDEDEIFHEISKPLPPSHDAPIASSYNSNIRPLLDAVDKLRTLNVIEEGIQLPTIVVVGDQSSGKSSVLESLAGISLPRGQGICTRVPLIMRLRNHSCPEPQLSLRYNDKIVNTSEDRVPEDIDLATKEIAGDGKGISHTPLTLEVNKLGVPDLTMVDLPGITRVPVHGQPENIYDQIRNIIMEYIAQEQSIILNVLSATVDFPTCESIRMSQSVDKTGARTLAVVTKADKAPEGLREKVTADDVHIGLGYVCVRNRIGNETYKEARFEEAMLFKDHSLLSQIDKSMVGIPNLAQKLVQIQAKSIDKNLPLIDEKIMEKLTYNNTQISKLPKKISSLAEATSTFMRIIGAVKDSLKKIVVRGEFDEYPDEISMHCTARLVEMLNEFSDKLHNATESDPKHNFLLEEIAILEESKAISLPQFLPRNAFLTILQKKVTGISNFPISFVDKLWDYIIEVIKTVMMQHVEHYEQLQLCAKRAAYNLIERMKEKSLNWVLELVEMEKKTDYTCNPEYISEWGRLLEQRAKFTSEVIHSPLQNEKISIDGFGVVDVEHLREHTHHLVEAFDLRMRIVSYWKIVLRRMVDSMAMHLQLSVHNLVDKELEEEVVKEAMGPYCGGIEKIMGESPMVSSKRAMLSASIQKLQNCKQIVGDIKDRISTSGSY